MSDVLALLRAEIGVVRHSEWLLVDQTMIDRFANVTLDRQYIHVDPVRAAASPFGGTVAHGFLTLSLLSRMAETTQRGPIPKAGMEINYGFDRVRFVNPVRSGSTIRAASTLVSVEEKRSGQFQQSCDIVVEIEGIDKPALTATWLTQFFI